MFKSDSYRFQWRDLGDIDGGRPNLGSLMNVAVYRLMQYTLRDVLNRHLSVEKPRNCCGRQVNLLGRSFAGMS
jgi:hypothetical protein